MNIPEARFTRGQRSGVFAREMSGLSSGVRTREEKDVLSGTQTRLDTSEDGQLRAITRSEDSIVYEITRWDRGVKTHVSASVDARTRFSKDAYLQTTLLDREKEQSISVTVGYDGSKRGKISSVILQVVPNTPSADEYRNIPDAEKTAFFQESTFEENMDEIAEIWDLRREKAFIITDENYQGIESEDMDTWLEKTELHAIHEIYDRLEKEGMGEAKQKAIVNGIYETVKRKVGKALKGKVDINGDDPSGIFSYLFSYTSMELIENFKSFQIIGELHVERALETAAAQCLTYYYSYVGTIGQSRIELTIDEKNHNKFAVKTEAMNEDQRFEGRVEEELSNGEYGLIIEYAGNDCLVTVIPFIGPKERITFTVPKSLAENLADQISQDGWAGAINALNMSHSSVQLQE